MTNPKVSVIIPNYNYSQYLGEAVEGVLSQTYENIEVIVVDDGSTDGSREVLERFGDKIRVIYQQNQGVSAARNNGSGESTGEFLAFLDADDVWLPEKIEKQVRATGENENIGLIHTGVIEIDTAEKEIATRLNGRDGHVAKELLQLDRAVILGGGSGILVRRSVFDRIGGFDTRMSTSADWDFFYRACCVCEVGFVPEILVKYRVHGSNMHANVRAMEHDVLIGFEKAFAGGDLDSEKNLAYAKFYTMLSGSYFQAGDYLDCVRSGLMSFRWHPPTFLKRLVTAGRGKRR